MMMRFNNKQDIKEKRKLIKLAYYCLLKLISTCCYFSLHFKESWKKKHLGGNYGGPRAGLYLDQRLRFVIQRGNAASLLGILPVDSVGEEFFDAF